MIRVLIAVVIFAFKSAIASTIIIDAGYPSSTISIEFGSPIGQSFTAEDALLGTIAFGFRELNPDSPNDPITLTLYEGLGAEGNEIMSVTQTVELSSNSFYEFIDFDFSGVVLQVGNVYSAALTTTSDLLGITFSGDSYAGGHMFSNDPIDLITITCGAMCDANFRVIPAMVPAPAAFWLFGSGIIGLIGLARHKTHA